MTKLKDAIKAFDSNNAFQLQKSATAFGLDLNHDYPDNLELIDGENVDRSDYEGDEYIEYQNGIPVYLKYSVNG